MKYIGLIKWFNIEKGFGIIGTPDDGDIFLHLANLLETPKKLSIATALIFETKKCNQKVSAINAQPPTSYEDFKLILSYLKRNPSISTDVIITRKDIKGNKHTYKESKSYSIIDYSLDQLLQKKQATEIFEFFKNYFEEQYLREGSEFITKFFHVTKEKIKGIKLELNDYLLEEFESKKNEKLEKFYSKKTEKNEDEISALMQLLTDLDSSNEFLIHKLIAYYLDKVDKEFLFEIWKNKTHLINSNSYSSLGKISSEENSFEFPSDFFFKNHSKISSSDLNRILNHAKGIEIVTEIVNKKISNLESISNNAVDEVLKSIQVLSKAEGVNNLRQLFTNKLLELLSECDFTEIKNETITTFNYFLDIVKNKSNNLNYDNTIQKFNESISDEAKFTLWLTTKYFTPEKNIFDNHFSQLSLTKLVELFKTELRKSTKENCIFLCKSLIPKFINADVVSLAEIIEIICNTEIDIKYRQEIFSHFSERASKFERVSLWFKEYTTKVDFNEVIEVFDKFSLNQQPNLLRKLFSLIQRNKDVSIENCLAQLSTLETNPKLNLNVRICLTVIKSLNSKQSYIGENILSEIVCQYVNENVSNLIQVHDLFQECRGRTWMTDGNETKKSWFLNIEGKDFHVDNETVNINDRDYTFDKEKKTVEIEGESYSFKWVKKENTLFEKLYDKPVGVTFCDAVKSQMDKTLKRNFYWCCNTKCYSPCQTDHIHLQWNNYSLRDFIKILKLPFEEDNYYRFVSVVNRANRLLKKLKCTSCNHLLRDKRTSEFAFYRVTTFHCTNSKCSKLHEVVYLTHCLNWRCLNVVDSRISVTCPNDWYICDSCSNCCSQDKLEKRLANLITNNAFNPNNLKHQKLKYQVDNNLGHMEREEKFNHKTGRRK